MRDSGVLASLPVIDDPWFYATAVVAVLILGIAKGGLAGQLELDFSHFRAQGHVLLAGALGDLLEDEELVASP